MSPWTLEDSKSKSSRSKADFFEITLTIKLRSYFGLPLNGFSKKLKRVKERLKKFKDGRRRTLEQEKRIKILLPSLKEKLDKLEQKYGQVTDVRWVGRKWEKEETISDLDIVFNHNHKIGISLKSTRQGKGTQKNLGQRKIKKFLGLDLKLQLKKMWENLRSDLQGRGGELEKIADMSKKKIRKRKYDFPIIQRLGKKYGAPIQKWAVKESVKIFNSLDKDKKINLLECVLGIDETKPILNVLVEGKTLSLYWDEFFKGIIQKVLTAEKSSNKGFYIKAGKEPLLRVQANFTNGIGLSPFCERFFIKKMPGSRQKI